MEAFLAVTDMDWFRHLSGIHDIDEVNFWSPTPKPLKNFRRGTPIFFKLKSPYNAIAGGGFFEHFTVLPISIAWDAFGEKNGAETLQEVRSRIALLRHDDTDPYSEYRVGCHVLVEPFFWERNQWIPQPENWPPNTVRGRTYDLRSGSGARLWSQVLDRLQVQGILTPPSARERLAGVDVLSGGYGDLVPRPRRIGQGTFRTVITDVYNRQCAVTRERALPALDAAHIKPFSEQPEHYVSNGLLLRSDVHRLFDTGYITVTPDYRVMVSPAIRSDFNDGESYAELDGSPVWVPEDAQNRPDRTHLKWNVENQFRG